MSEPLNFIDALVKLQENPERIITTDNGYLWKYRLRNRILEFEAQSGYWCKSKEKLYWFMRQKWTIIEPTHTAIEAVQAYREGKEVKPSDISPWHHKKNQYGDPFNRDTIQHDNWQIRERRKENES